MAFAKKKKQEKIGKHGRVNGANNANSTSSASDNVANVTNNVAGVAQSQGAFVPAGGKKTGYGSDFRATNQTIPSINSYAQNSAMATAKIPNGANFAQGQQTNGAGGAGYAGNAGFAGNANFAGYQANQNYAPYNDNFDLEPKHTGKKVAIGIGIFVGVLLIIYLVGALIFSNTLYPNTTFNSEDVSMMSTDDLAKKLNNKASNYKLTITSANGYSETITANDIGLQNASGSTMDSMVPTHNAWAWPVEVFKKRDISNSAKTTYDTAKLNSLVSTAVDNYNATATQPVNANIAYNATTATFEVTKEVVGTALDKDLVLAAVTLSANEMEEKLTLDASYLLQPTLLSTDSRLQTALQTAQKMCKSNVTYTVGGTAITVLNSSVLAPMITMDATCNVTLDSNKLNEWAGGISDQLNTVGSTRTYTRPDGKVITVSGGAYGWIVDAETFANQVKADAMEGTTKTVAVQCEQEGTGFLGLGQADWGKRYVDVDLSEQYVRFYDDAGNIIWQTACVSGAPTDNHSTPTGVWYVNAKESPSTLIGYTSSGSKEYETKVQFWMPFEGNGVGFHDATWQSSFGGTRYKDGYGSHGCINISYSAAESLYGIIAVNDVVVVHD